MNSLFKRKKNPLRVHITLAIEGGKAAAVAILASTFAHTLFPSEKEMLIKAKRKASFMMRWDDPEISGYIQYSTEITFADCILVLGYSVPLPRALIASAPGFFFSIS